MGKEWVSTIKEGITQDSLYFPRSTSSTRAVKKPRLVGFWDRSSQAFSAAVYVVFMVSKHKENKEESFPEGDLEDKDYNPEEYERNGQSSLSRTSLRMRCGNQ